MKRKLAALMTTTRLLLALLLALSMLATLAAPALAAAPSIELAPQPPEIFVGETLTVSLDYGSVKVDEATVQWSGELTPKNGGAPISLFDLATDPELEPIDSVTILYHPKSFTVLLPAAGKLSLKCNFSDANDAPYDAKTEVDVLPPPAKSVSIVDNKKRAMDTLTLGPGKEQTLRLILSPKTTEDKIKKAEWSTSDSEVARVTEGTEDTTKAKVMAGAGGSAKITVTVTTDRRDKKKKSMTYTAELTVTVPLQITASYVNFSEKDMLRVEGNGRAGHTVELYCVATGSGGSSAPVGSALASGKLKAKDNSTTAADFLISDILEAISTAQRASPTSGISDDKVLVRCVGADGEVLASLLVDLKEIGPSKDTTIDGDDDVTFQIEGTGDTTVAQGIGDGGVQYVKILDFGTVKVRLVRTDGKTISDESDEGLKTIFIPAGVKYLEDLVQVMSMMQLEPPTEYRDQCASGLDAVAEVWPSEEGKKVLQDVNKHLKAMDLEDVSVYAPLIKELTALLEAEAKNSQAGTANNVDIQPGDTAGRLIITNGGDAEGAVFVSGNDVMSSLRIVGGKGKLAATVTKFLDAQGKETAGTLLLGPADGGDALASLRMGGLTNHFSKVDPSVVGFLGASASLSDGQDEATVDIPGPMTVGEDGTVDIPIPLSRVRALQAQLKKAKEAARAASVRTADEDEEEPEDEPFILTVSVTAQRTDTGAEGVTVATVPVVIASDGSGGGSSSAGCDALSLGGAAMMALAGMAVLRRKA